MVVGFDSPTQAALHRLKRGLCRRSAFAPTATAAAAEEQCRVRGAAVVGLLAAVTAATTLGGEVNERRLAVICAGEGGVMLLHVAGSFGAAAGARSGLPFLLTIAFRGPKREGAPPATTAATPHRRETPLRL